MAQGNKIVVKDIRFGKPFLTEGIIATGETPYPGTAYQIAASTARKHGIHTWTVYNRDADSNRPAGPIIILTEDQHQGKLATDAYAAGDHAWGFVPLPGDELNVLFFNQSGTADDVALGDLLIIDDGTGKFFTTTGSPEIEPAMALEAITDPTADQLFWVVWTGY